MLDPFQLLFVQRALLEVALLAIGAGLVGTWIVMRGLAFYSHAVAAGAFPGLVVADGLGFAPALGAFGAAVLFAIAVGGLARAHSSGYDSLTGLVLTGFLALGVVLASDVFHSGSNIETLLFGSILVIGTRDLVLAGAASAAMLAANAALGRVWLATGFDAGAARALGMRSSVPETILLLLIALCMIATLTAVGALLATALVVVPAATVRLWTKRLGPWQAITVALTAVEGAVGVWASVKLNAPAGAAIAVLTGGAFALAAAARALAQSRPRGGRAAIAATGVLAALVVAGCGAGSSASSGLRVVATTTQIGDWTRAVGGGLVDVHQILKANTDPHDYEPRPADVQAFADAKLVFTNGDNLDKWSGKLADEAGGNATMVDLGTALPVRVKGETSGPEGSTFDPHWWHDPSNVVAAVGRIAGALAKADPAGARTFAYRARAYIGKLHALDRSIRSCLDRIPRPERKLVTDHDAFNYFAGRYGIQVVGAVIPSQTTEAGASAKGVTNLAGLIKREHVRAVFPESSLSPKLARTLAAETGASSDYTLYGDTLGKRGSAGDTYLKMEAANAAAMARGFSGGKVRCKITTTR
jgi:ABC-type Zn uptake system ZnuABC Zn-binding protein ZnuA/ABC-type Mn2+/Zn2+ transport system permease subunit